MYHDASLNIRQLQVFEAVARPRATAGPAGAGISAPPSAMPCRSWRDSSASPSASAGAAFLDRERPAVLQQAIRVLSELNELERQSALLVGSTAAPCASRRSTPSRPKRRSRCRWFCAASATNFPMHIKLIIRTPAATERRAEQPYRRPSAATGANISEPLYREQHWLLQRSAPDVLQPPAR